MQRKRVRVKAQVEIERDVDVTTVLDGWDLAEVRAFVDDPDPQGKAICVDEGSNLKEHRRITFRHDDLAAYLEHREAA